MSSRSQPVRADAAQRFLQGDARGGPRHVDVSPGDAFPREAWVAWFQLAAIGFGLVCRVSQYAANTSIWHDEAFVALNVLQKSVAGLLGPLEWSEAAPPGFLVVEKIVTAWLGHSEYAFRLIPLLAGLAGIICFAGFARRVSGGGVAMGWAVLLMAGSEKLIVQANEVKHFTLDVLWAILLGWLAIRTARLRHPGAALLMWGALGAAGLWFSFASVFVFAGTSLALAPLALRGWDQRQRLAYLVANIAACGSFLLLLGPIRAQRTGVMLTFWADSFPATQSLPALLYWLGRSHLGLFNYLWQPLGAPLLGLALLGGLRLWRTGRRVELCCLWLPVVAALAASFLSRWPFGGSQHMVFAAPAAILLEAEGIEAIRGRLAGWPRWAGVGCLLLLLLPGLANAAYRIGFPRQRHEVRPVIEFVQRHRKPGDQFLVFCPAEVQFYTGVDFRGTSLEPDGSARVWLIATYARSGALPVQGFLERLRTRRPQLDMVETYGAVAYLFGPESVSGEPVSP